MRFSILALLVALPAAACATLSSQQLSVRDDGSCIESGGACAYYNVCCGDDTFCLLVNELLGVCSSVYSLPLTDWYAIRRAS